MEHSNEQAESIAGLIFDKLAEASGSHEDATDLQLRVVAAASIIALSRGEERWCTVLDAAMADRGVQTHFSDLSLRQLHGQFELAGHRAAVIGQRSRSTLDLLAALNNPAE